MAKYEYANENLDVHLTCVIKMHLAFEIVIRKIKR